LGTRGILVLAGSESYSFDIAHLASDFGDVLVIRYTPLDQFMGSVFEVYRVNKEKKKKIMQMNIPYRKINWFIMIAPLFIINSLSFLTISIKAVKTLRGSSNEIVAIGIGWGGTLTAYLLKCVHIVSRFAYYRVDWFPAKKGDTHKYLSALLFYLIDRFLCKHADYIWHLTHAIEATCPEKTRKKYGRNIVVFPPIMESQPDDSRLKVNQPYLVYFGEIKQGCGLPIVLSALSILMDRGVSIAVKVIGRADKGYLNRLFCDFRHLFEGGICEYLGPVNVGNEREYERLTKILKSAYCGLAINPGGTDNPSNFSLQNRVILYLKNCLPTIINNDSAVARYLVTFGLGVSVEPSPPKVADLIQSIVNQPNLVASLRSNIRSFLQKRLTVEPIKMSLLALIQGKDIVISEDQ
jgi:glycosyltransferase involved in cell wall biosynthesis